jgi:hypothetical protein
MPIVFSEIIVARMQRFSTYQPTREITCFTQFFVRSPGQPVARRVAVMNDCMDIRGLVHTATGCALLSVSDRCLARTNTARFMTLRVSR